MTGIFIIVILVDCDKGYFGAETKAYDAAMRMATRGHPLSINERISILGIVNKKGV